MIATCKFCRVLIHPLTVLPIKPAQLAKIPPLQLEVMKFSAGVTEHMRANHPEYIAHTQGLAGSFIGHCMVAAVEVAGENSQMFDTMNAHDSAMVRAHWDAMPNPPHPDVIAQIEGETRAELERLRGLGLVTVEGDGTIDSAANSAVIVGDGLPFTPPPPGKIKLN